MPALAQLWLASAGMDDELRSALDEFQTSIREFEADGQIDDDERAHLRDLLERIETLLEEEPDEHHGLVDQLEESAIKFEGRHPTVAATIRSAVDTLTGLGM